MNKEKLVLSRVDSLLYPIVKITVNTESNIPVIGLTHEDFKIENNFNAIDSSIISEDRDGIYNVDLSKLSKKISTNIDLSKEANDNGYVSSESVSIDLDLCRCDKNHGKYDTWNRNDGIIICTFCNKERL